MTDFCVHPRLGADSLFVGDAALSRVLLFDDCRYPWVILVPRVSDLREIYELPAADRNQLLEESCLVGRWLMREFAADKLNVAAIGNLVPQLHLHHVARYRDDPAWPGPVWGHSPAVRYSEAEAAGRVAALRDGLGLVVAAD